MLLSGKLLFVKRKLQVVEFFCFQISELKKKVFGDESGPSTKPKKSADSNAQTQEQIQRYLLIICIKYIINLINITIIINT